ncbi:MAG: stage 0 sporulation protein [Magnetococcales bacterium]|nr:stage 0 sporulation protein [Magnetococcales bacterium]
MTYRVAARMPMLQAGAQVVVQTRHGEESATVAFSTHTEETPEQDRLLPGPITQIKRAFTPADHDFQKWRVEKEAQARKLCKESIRRLGLTMRLSRVTFLPDRSKAIFYFTAENRVDFRELVRVLARNFQIRVEMRQIGVRDETRLLSGLGPCGQVFCCAGHLDKFHPVSVRMAKNQELSLNPDAISGVCGRLMCCLGFENDLYRTLRGSLPKINCRMRTPEGREVQIRGIHPLRGVADVQYNDEVGGKGTLSISELTYIDPRDRPAGSKNAEEETAVVEEADLPVVALLTTSPRPATVTRKEKSPPEKPAATATTKSAEGGEKRRRRRRGRKKKGPDGGNNAPNGQAPRADAPDKPPATGEK